MDKQYFAYVRVSTAKQGEHGVSLKEQRDAIERHAERYGFTIAQWFEERETAAKRGRPIFSAVIQLLRGDKAQGIILHKIDRGARNLKDWADLGELIDAGVEVHFANEGLDLNTRGGRLSADIQAVVAADYIRNLREEAKKGFYGRLKQGIYPMQAPIGYRDCGGGKPKEPDRVIGHLVARTFEIYATGRYSLPRLREEMHKRGLRNHRGGRVSLNGLSTILNNPFYAGLIRIKKTGEVFEGIHQPIIGKSLFDHVQKILKGKTINRITRHEFTFRRMVRCTGCGYSLIAERKKGHVYYRCHSANCETKSVREESIDQAIVAALRPLRMCDEEMIYLQNWFRKAHREQEALHLQVMENCQLRLDQVRSRRNRLTDAYIDGALDRSLFEERKASLLSEESGIKERLGELEEGKQKIVARLEKILGRAKSVSDAYETAISYEKRDLAKDVTSDLAVSGKNVVVVLKNAHQLIANRQEVTDGGPRRGARRTWDRLLEALMELLAKNPEYEATPTAN